MESRVYSDEELKELQYLEKEALKEILSVCEKIGVQCFLMSGSALGAVRHGGFIPWDDDIDVAMLREDYNLFVREAQNYLDEKYYLQTPYDNKINPYFYSKLRINGTRFVEFCNHKLPMHQGVYVDIFPFDAVPDDEEKNKKHFRKCQTLFVLFTVRQSPDRSKEAIGFFAKIKSFLRFCFHIILRLIPHDLFVKYIDSVVQSYNGTGQKAVAGLNYTKRKANYILLEDLFPLKSCSFDEIEALIPCNYDTYLQSHYGDYWVLPPEEKRFGHKPYVVKLH